jgi:protein-S-isoprenylcysteine O-methyltransferase Ste14
MSMPPAALPLHRRIVPPLYLLAALLAMIVLDHYVPTVRFRMSVLMGLGTALILGGVALAAWGATTFRRAGTPVRPFEEATTLVTTGPFRWTRNPMYLGMLLVLGGAWIALGSLTPALLLPVFFLIIRTWFIRHEEAAMAERFGEEFNDYCRRVRRWI